MDKTKALDAALSQIERAFGKGSIMRMGNKAADAEIEVISTGSLGQGLGIATGGALAARLQTSSRRVFALLSDAECNEGSTWEAAMFAGHHRLDALAVVVDLNGQQALGPTAGILDQSALAARWRAGALSAGRCARWKDTILPRSPLRSPALQGRRWWCWRTRSPAVG